MLVEASFVGVMLAMVALIGARGCLMLSFGASALAEASLVHVVWLAIASLIGASFVDVGVTLAIVALIGAMGCWMLSFGASALAEVSLVHVEWLAIGPLIGAAGGSISTSFDGSSGDGAKCFGESVCVCFTGNTR